MNYDVKLTFDADIYVESVETNRLLRQGLWIAGVELDRPTEDVGSAPVFDDADAPAPGMATEVLVRAVQSSERELASAHGASFWRLGLAPGDCVSIAIPDDAGTIGDIRDGFAGMGSIAYDPEARHVPPCPC